MDTTQNHTGKDTQGPTVRINTRTYSEKTHKNLQLEETQGPANTISRREKTDEYVHAIICMSAYVALKNLIFL